MRVSIIQTLTDIKGLVEYEKSPFSKRLLISIEAAAFSIVICRRLVKILCFDRQCIVFTL